MYESSSSVLDAGSVYVCGYEVEGNMSDDPALWQQFRCLHNGRESGRIDSLMAGLHYLVALDDKDGQEGLVWGKCPLPGSSEMHHCATKVGVALEALWEVHVFGGI